ncbi:hypothetical protein EUTSA_v10022950mg [Eutrema salsugineum]|uniref:Uncharacterized protein n=1 Tax=Eutrema salsugineum TaxID=72664 RepID=V4M786_EUTSA|nr:hypothetical protein EUTSA_v10022950mg [Eutrema salsugineum]
MRVGEITELEAHNVGFVLSSLCFPRENFTIKENKTIGGEKRRLYLPKRQSLPISSSKSLKFLLRIHFSVGYLHNP